MAQKKIRGNTYEVGEMLAIDALRLKAKLLKVIGSGVERLPVILAGRGDNATKEDKAKSDGAAVAAFTDIFVNGDPDEMANLVKEVFELASIHRPSGSVESVDMDNYTANDMPEVFEVVVFVLRETFGPLFSGIAGNSKIKKVMDSVSQKGKPSESPQT